MAVVLQQLPDNSEAGVIPTTGQVGLWLSRRGL